jgi:uncharacterized RDD family membrane protein YckC
VPGPPPGPGYGPVYGPPPGHPAYGPPPGSPAYGPPPPGYPAYGPPPYGYPVPQPPALSPGGWPLADFGTRLLAALIDGLIMGAVGAVISVPLFIYAFSQMSDLFPTTTDPVTGEPQPDPSKLFDGFFSHVLLLELGLGVVLLAVYYVYYVEMAYRSGQTVGKRVMKIRIIPIDPTAQLTRGMAAVRYLIEFVAATFVPFLPYLDGLWQLWDKPYQQTLHDKAAKTVVIKVSV